MNIEELDVIKNKVIQEGKERIMRNIKMKIRIRFRKEQG